MIANDFPQGFPKLVVFEGVDGVGKTTLADALTRYCQHHFAQMHFASGTFPGSSPGTLGEWVYRLHHLEIEDLSPRSIASSALQLLHVAAHVDAVLSWISPALKDGYVILDRYWWSTYAYSRMDLCHEKAWALVAAEHPFWQMLPSPTIIYLTRGIGLKPDELDQRSHRRLDRHYRTLIARERAPGVTVHELADDGDLDECWSCLLGILHLPYAPL